jgi:hypothetical protein
VVVLLQGDETMNTNLLLEILKKKNGTQRLTDLQVLPVVSDGDIIL